MISPRILSSSPRKWESMAPTTRCGRMGPRLREGDEKERPCDLVRIAVGACLPRRALAFPLGEERVRGTPHPNPPPQGGREFLGRRNAAVRDGRAVLFSLPLDGGGSGWGCA